jgi:hypothetical protein
MTGRPQQPQTLFPDPGPSLAEGMARLQEQIRRAMPLKSKHRAVLPGGVRRLSAFLTVERENLPRDYMTRPEYLAAYLNYFLPWNVFRQGLLLQGLGLDLAPGAKVLDLGAGPLTFLQALWLARPQLRDAAIDYTGVDRSEPAMKAGRSIFSGLAGADGAAWSVQTSRSLSARNRQPVDLLVAANFINELEAEGRGRRGPEDGATAEDQLLDRWENQVAANGSILLIEPAMRATARKVSRLRQVALQRGWQAVAPCPHQGDCPMPGLRGGPWCHFNFRPEGAPDWLVRFSNEVRLPKERGSLSFLLLRRGEQGAVRTATPRPDPGRLPVRAISEPFDLPDWKRGSYGCTEKGLVLLQGRPQDPPPRPGQLLWARWPRQPEKDRKSGAWILPRSS